MISTLCKAASFVHVNKYFSTCDTKTTKVGEVEERFIQHISEFGYSYGTQEEYSFRLSLFTEVDAELAKINKKNTSFTVGHNFFSTLTKAEQKKRFGRKPNTEVNSVIMLKEKTAVTAIDWREKGAVNPVQDQGQCGSCWAFSATAAMEGAHFIKTGTLLKHSEQQFVDCVKLSAGCNGGLEIRAFEYAMTNPQELETSYPYTAKTGKCSADTSKEIVRVTGYANVAPKSVDELKNALANQPTCVAVDASDNQFMYYTGGILDTKTCGGANPNLDHAITAVGYGTENGKGYFIVRNSWTATWGEAGYIRMSSDVGGNGVCGVLMDASRPITD